MPLRTLSTSTNSFFLVLLLLLRPPQLCFPCVSLVARAPVVGTGIEFILTSLSPLPTSPPPKKKTKQRRRRRAPRPGRRLARDRVGPDRDALRRLQVRADPRGHRVPRHDLALLQGAKKRLRERGRERERRREREGERKRGWFSIIFNSRVAKKKKRNQKRKKKNRTSTTTPSATSSSSAPARPASRARTSSPRTPRSRSRSSSRVRDLLFSRFSSAAAASADEKAHFSLSLPFMEKKNLFRRRPRRRRVARRPALLVDDHPQARAQPPRRARGPLRGEKSFFFRLFFVFPFETDTPRGCREKKMKKKLTFSLQKTTGKKNHQKSRTRATTSSSSTPR